jgi:Trk-type K+ transport system membrane component
MDFFTVHFTLMQNEPKHQVDLRTLLRTSRVSCLILLPLFIIMLQSLILITMFILPLVTSANRQFFSDVVGMASLMNI